MPSEKTILDRIIERRNVEQATQFNPAETISELLKELSAKEREVIGRRFGLFGAPAQTLELIGKKFNITRERIRQIQWSAVKKIKNLATAKQLLQPMSQTVQRLMHEHGGVMEHQTLFAQLLSHTEAAGEHQQAAEFVVSQLLSDEVERVRPSDRLYAGWKLPLVDLEFVHAALTVLSDIISTKQTVLPLTHLLDAFKAHEFFSANRSQFLPLPSALTGDDGEAIDRALQSFLTISRRIERNILDEWGLAEWPNIRPRRMGDKIYLVLKQAGKPLHFTEITNLINQAKMDHKVAYPATIHNELILDDRYVLVGRGLYALKDWGYQPGTVLEVVMNVLSAAGRPMTRDEIVREVARQRLVRKSTIFLALTKKDKIARVGDRFTLQTNASTAPAPNA